MPRAWYFCDLRAAGCAFHSHDTLRREHVDVDRAWVREVRGAAANGGHSHSGPNSRFLVDVELPLPCPTGSLCAEPHCCGSPLFGDTVGAARMSPPCHPPDNGCAIVNWEEGKEKATNSALPQTVDQATDGA